MIGCSQLLSSFGMLLKIIGLLNSVPFTLFLIEALGERQSFLSLNSPILAGVGVIVGHFTPTLISIKASIASLVT